MIIASPCIGVCKIDKATNYCAGCYRTIDEIKQWKISDDGYKNELLDILRQRRTDAGIVTKKRPNRRKKY